MATIEVNRAALERGIEELAENLGRMTPVQREELAREMLSEEPPWGSPPERWARPTAVQFRRGVARLARASGWPGGREGV